MNNLNTKLIKNMLHLHVMYLVSVLQIYNYRKFEFSYNDFVLLDSILE